MKTVLHCALVAPMGYTTEPWIKAFIENGFHSYYPFDLQSEIYLYGIEQMRRNLVSLAHRTKPDLIFLHVQKSEWLDLDTFRELSNISSCVLYTFDVREKEQTEWMYQAAPYMTLVCFSNQEDVFEAIYRGVVNSIVVQSSCDMDIYQPWHMRNPFMPLVSFVGTNYAGSNNNFPLAQERADMVALLGGRYGGEFRAYGMGWNNGSLTKSREEVEIYSSSKILISQNNFDRTLYTSDRIWRIMATGGFCLTKYFKGIESLFQRGVHLDWWHDFDELVEKIDYYLNNDEKRRDIGANGCEFVRAEHTWTKRVEKILSIIKRPEVVDDSKPCWGGVHRVKGVMITTDEYASQESIPADRLEFDNSICDCGKLRYRWEECGCVQKVWRIRAYENS